MTTTPSPRRLSKGQLAWIVGIDAVALAIGLSLFAWLSSKDSAAAVMALIASLTFGGFFSLVIVLVSLKP